MQEALNSAVVEFLKEGITQNGVLEFSGFHIDFRYRKGNKEFLLVGFDGWDPEKSYSHAPTYSKWRYLKSMDCNCLYISHPIFQGKRISHSIYTALLNALKIQNIVFHLIRLAVNSLKLNTANIIFYGGSSGGFSALQYALHFKNSKCCTINPETSVLAHNLDIINKYKHLVLNHNANNKSVARLNLNNHVVKKNIGLPNIIIHQNLLDEFYYDSHFLGFSEIFRSRVKEVGTGSLTVIEYVSDVGHTSEISNSLLGASLLMLMNTNRPATLTADCKLRLIYKKISMLSLDIIVTIKFSPANALPVNSIFLSFSRNKLYAGIEIVNRVSLEDFERDGDLLIWSGKLDSNQNYVYLQSDEDLSGLLVNIDEIFES